MNKAYRLEVKNLSLIYKNLLPTKEDFGALTDVSVTFEAGRIYGLIGRNGAGKTSLLSVLASFRKASQGTIKLNDENLFDNGELMQHVQFVYQKEFNSESGELYPKARKYIKRETLYRPDFDQKYADELIQKFKLPTNKRPNKLSKGMQSILSVIIGLASRTPITIFDEAYLGMDAWARDLFYKEILKERERHPRTFILSSHLIAEMEYLFDEVIIIHKGHLTNVGTYDEIVSKGQTITGATATVDEFVKDKKTLNTETLGGVKKVTIFGNLTDQERRLATEMDLEIATISLQDLFIHLTKDENEKEADENE